MIERDHQLLITHQTKLLQLSRGSVCAKYERVYNNAYDSISAARAAIADYLVWYNAHWAHSSLDRLTPDESYSTSQFELKLTA